MIKESFCTSKELFQCVYVTKDNIEEFVNEHGVLIKNGIRDEYEIIYSGNYAYVKYKNSNMTWHIKLNTFMVNYGWDGGWTSYTEKEFNECFELKN